jgi:DNA-binding XRE family transcriptional regulator
MKTFDEYLKKLPATERATIAEGARRKIAAIRLQQAREVTGLTQEQVAVRMGITQATLSRMEHRPAVKLSNIRRYIEAIDGKLEVNAVLPKRSCRRDGRTNGRGRPTTAQRISLVSG